MNIASQYIANVCAIVLVVGCRLVCATDNSYNEGKVPDYEDYVVQQMDYGHVIETATRPPIQCYTCHYHIEKDHTQGMPNCDHDFIKEGIPIIPCSGPCAKVFQHLAEDQFILTRNCVPNCKDHADEKSYTECCSSDLCNSATTINYVSTLISLTTLAAILTLCVRFR